MVRLGRCRQPGGRALTGAVGVALDDELPFPSLPPFSADSVPSALHYEMDHWEPTSFTAAGPSATSLGAVSESSTILHHAGLVGSCRGQGRAPRAGRDLYLAQVARSAAVNSASRRRRLTGARHGVQPESSDRWGKEPPLGDHLFACVAVGAAPEGDDLLEAAGGVLCRERR